MEEPTPSIILNFFAEANDGNVEAVLATLCHDAVIEIKARRAIYVGEQARSFLRTELLQRPRHFEIQRHTRLDVEHIIALRVSRSDETTSDALMRFILDRGRISTVRSSLR
jgi:hypothetical protein